jgi:glycosyltransferase involved in cell wall biosynthesis
LVEAWELWNPSPSEARLTICTHAIPRSLERRLKVLKSRGSIEVRIGRLSPEALERTHRQCHFVVNPAAWEEPGSATVYEGLFFGTPSLVPARTGSADFIENNVNGIVYPFRSIEGLVAALREACAGIGHWPAMHREALRAASKYLDGSRNHMEVLTRELFGDRS